PTGYYWLNAPSPSVRINLLDSDDAVTIAPGENFTVQYEAIPVIYPQMSANFYRIGVDENGNGSLVRYSYAGQSGQIESYFHAVGNMPTGPLVTAVEAAFASSDYLLVTNLYRLQSGASNANQIPGLLMDMARLARDAEGVIALPTNLATAVDIDDLLEPNGFWYESLHPNFRQTLGGYVLFVGEEEIIPVQSGGWGVDYSDLRYASTGGAARPELVLGRITGDNVANLRKPIQAAASFHRTGAFFDGSHALIWSGRSDGEGTFWSNVKGMDSRLSDRGTAVTRFRGKDYSNETDLLTALQQNSTGRDWIIYRGHGYRYGFADVGGYAVRTDTVNTLNLNARPVVLALACTTGDYRQNSDGDNSIGEAFLANGAAVFVGSIETSSRDRNSSASRAYFNRWHDGRPVGEILADIMRDTWGDSSWWWPDSMTWERWAYDYHTFGDPKYGMGVAPPKSSAEGDETTAVSLFFNDTAAATINVNLPDLEIIPLDEGWHEVILPEGNQLALRDDY
ncbi:MAG: hypothetical protein KDD89_14095, partial [Anaerolineales bacterium]|nr:hypothetical protein [Anaerolineales bacterium]